MGCCDACPIFTGERYLGSELEDPAGKSVEEVRLIRDRSTRVRTLFAELLPAAVLRAPARQRVRRHPTLWA
jgi:arsenate reductase